MRHPDEVEELLSKQRFDALVLDDYSTSIEQETRWRAQVGALVVIDDLADRRHLADLLVDPGYGRIAADYDDLLPVDARRFVGPAYAIIGQAFIEARAAALARPYAP